MEIFGCTYGTSGEKKLYITQEQKCSYLLKILIVILFLVLFNKLLAPVSEMECHQTVFSKPQKGCIFTASKFQTHQ